MDNDFEVRKFSFTIQNINLFKRYNFARPLHLNHLNKLKKSTIKDNFIIGNAIIVNQIDDFFYIINGGHRIEIYKQLLTSLIIDKIISVLIIYKGLSEEQIKEKMKIMGLTDKNQDLDSLLEVYKENIFLWRNLDNLQIPINIKKRKKFFKFRDILYILQVKNSPKMNYGKSTENTLDFALETNKEDLEFLKEFLDFFINKFGEFSSENKLWGSYFIIPFSSVYGRNKIEVIDNDRIYNLFKDRKIDELLDYKQGTREASQRMRDRILQILNITEKKEENES